MHIFLLKKQGYILGNPVTDTKLEHNYLIPFAYGMALISEELYEVFFNSHKKVWYFHP